MKIEVFIIPGCCDGLCTAQMVANVVQEMALAVEVETIPVATPEDARRVGFLGSPSVRVDGMDVDPQAPTQVGLT
jgi:hypothetical protein